MSLPINGTTIFTFIVYDQMGDCLGADLSLTTMTAKLFDPYGNEVVAVIGVTAVGSLVTVSLPAIPTLYVPARYTLNVYSNTDLVGIIKISYYGSEI